MTYAFTVEKFSDTYAELEPLYRTHYGEMTARLETQGIKYSPYNPRLDAYIKSGDEGWLLTFVLRLQYLQLIFDKSQLLLLFQIIAHNHQFGFAGTVNTFVEGCFLLQYRELTVKIRKLKNDIALF